MTALGRDLASDRLPLDVPRKRRRWPRIVFVVSIVLTVIVTAATAAFQFGLPWWIDEGDRNHVYRSEAGSLRYAVNCWNSAVSREQRRYDGEPALLTGVARQVIEHYNVDPDRSRYHRSDVAGVRDPDDTVMPRCGHAEREHRPIPRGEAAT